MTLAITDDEIARRYPRTDARRAHWFDERPMGPHVLWLAEHLAGVMSPKPGMRVLDLGCGRATSSIFFAEEFGVQVWAADLWIKPTENLRRIGAAGLGERVYPISVEAHALPFAEGFFDAIVSLDAYHYFGTNDLYTAEIARLLKPGGQLGIVVPGLTRELDELPAHLEPYWEPAFWSFHSPEWWRRHWDRSGAFGSVTAGLLPDGAALWERWLELSAAAGVGNEPERAMLAADGGRALGFTWAVGTVPR